MTDKTDRKPSPPAYLAAIPQALRGTEIPIRMVRFRDVIDIPHQAVTQGCEASDDGRPNARRYEIALVPQLRQYVIAAITPERPPVVCYVHESQVATSYPIL